MDTRDLMNHVLYPQPGDNARRKDFPYYDTLPIATGQTEYFFFTQPLGNQFLRNKKLPLAGSEIYLIDEINMLLQTNLNTTALVNACNELLQQSYLLITIDGRVVCKLPGLDFLTYMKTNVYTATGVALDASMQKIDRKLPLPIFINSTSSVEIKFVTTTAAATAFNGINLRLNLHGVEVDKLQSFYYDNLKNNKFQLVPVTYYQTFPIVNGNETTYNLFTNPAANPNLFSQIFPLSDITTFSLQNLEVFVNQPDTPIEPTTIFYSRIQNILKINIDDVDVYNSNCQEFLSLHASFSQALTTTPDLTVIDVFNIRQSKTLRVPLEIPANSKVNMTLQQQASSLGITGELTVCLRGVETRRVA